MSEFFKLIAFCAVAWTVFLAVPIAATLIGVVLALGVLYFINEVAQEETDDVNDNDNQNSD